MSYSKICVIIALFLLSSCGQTKKDKPEKAPALPLQAIEKFTVTESEEGKPRWVLEAFSAQIFESEKKILLELPKIQFFAKGKYVSRLTAEKGRINTENYDIWGEGECFLETEKGEELKTRNLYYKSDVNKIFSKNKIKLTRPNEIIYGEGLEATPDLENIIIKKQKVEIKK